MPIECGSLFVKYPSKNAELGKHFFLFLIRNSHPLNNRYRMAGYTLYRVLEFFRESSDAEGVADNNSSQQCGRSGMCPSVWVGKQEVRSTCVISVCVVCILCHDLNVMQYIFVYNIQRAGIKHICLVYSILCDQILENGHS